MAIKFALYEASAAVEVDGVRIRLDDSDIQQLWCETACLYDTDHYGSAIIQIGDRKVCVTEDEWAFLHAQTSPVIDRAFLAYDLENDLSWDALPPATNEVGG